MNRRNAMKLAAAAPVWVQALAPSQASAQMPASRMGVGTTAFAQRLRYERNNPSATPLADPQHFLEYCHQIGAGGIQVNLSSLDGGRAKQFRRKAEEYGMYVEASLALPRGDTDLSRFQQDVRTARAAGATVIRTVMLRGRRYETFTSAEAFRHFATQSWNSLTAAEPVIRKNRMKLAIENHKDWRIDEMLSILQRLSSEFVGICVDTGNNIALLDDAHQVAEAFAPYAYAVHLKDMAVKEYDKGFFLSEVVFGHGYLDLRRIVQVIRQAQPNVQFTLEMITRDPLEVPCLTEEYWATMDSVPGRDLASTLRTVRQKQSAEPLPAVNHLSAEERVKVEDGNNRKCLAFARDHLGL